MSQPSPFLLQEPLADGGMAQLWGTTTTHAGTPGAKMALSATTAERERTDLAHPYARGAVQAEKLMAAP